MAENYDYEVLYIGAGHGTFDGAAPLAATGVKVGIIESGLIGGTCPNRGCNAKISLDEPVKMVRERERLGDVLDGDISMNWTQNVVHKQEIIDVIPAGLTAKLENAGATIIKGYAKFKDQHTVLVDDTKPVTAEKIVISTGLRPHRLDIPGTELAHDSEDFMNLQTMPKNVTIIGSGYIGMEFATMANAAGSEVTVMLHSDKVLRKFYQPFVQQVVDDLKKRGVKFVENADIKSFSEENGKFDVTYQQDQHLSTDWILDATGRIPNVENLGLENVGVKFDKTGVIVNDHLQTNVENIYASGDVISSDQPKLTPTAFFESHYLMKLFARQTTDPIDFPVIPSVVFTSPRIAKAGMSVEEGQEKGYTITDNDLANYWYYQIDKEQIAASKQVHDTEGHLVGVTEISDQAENTVNTLLPAIEFKMSREQVGRLIGIFPTIGYAAWHRA
ncbi:dihydrolipoyl dehydrogenase family protein [Companilactobacillus sp.]|jgi:glutathione reductase (NADPH)|uniref:dihydrolipoyl dehydrogenase family protein n=1 Tax=Companilactobacillus sp. TaxID=2767905 RepID=UPI0025C296AE|nr:NAD(P)/FAD-dependent oxidoreductase [Companilactobacillus sp.]MCH4008857.1 NAD(P)/FAD-dependent oxidoreductase [Companilactobacillus sp.]MCH4050964.1 NAD(P)/FAD-dependent oxidoreductase [Companilactobacillus sp.]MCH4076800.1 NAD(P)/FAD-dependent oxidoreductase [Companilactobacillus sp.]MCH4125375.1 NAD(P)/FAD-dependent oxidoreductase [Companilactobacillus sp.]MCH4131917.1 NAD(P)/FAD-dependent oxidoreductase [Companilactobacillus sp.]